MRLRLNRLFAGLAVVALALVAGSPPGTAHEQNRSPGVVVEGVARNSAGDKAGVKAGDVLLSWTRAAAPPAYPEGAAGDFFSPFDVTEIEAEEAPRGEMTVSGLRKGASFALVVPPGAWGITARPHMTPPMVAAYDDARNVLAKQEPEKGVAVWMDLAAQASSSGDLRLAAWLLVKVGNTLATGRGTDETHAAYGSAIAAAKELGEPTVIATILEDKGAALERRKEFPEAEAVYRDALRLRVQVPPETLAMAATLVRLANVVRFRGDMAGAEESYSRALAIQERLAPQSLTTAVTLNHLGNAARNRGDLTTAENLHRRALSLKEKLAPDSQTLAVSLVNLANVLQTRGDLAAAEELHERALIITEKLTPNTLAVAVALGNLGVVAHDRGDLPRAEGLQRRSLAIREKLDPNGAEVAVALNNLGMVLRERDPAAAMDLYKRLLALTETLRPAEVASVLNNLGILLQGRGDLAAAEDYYRRSLEIKEKRAPGSTEVALTLNNLGVLAKDRGDLAVADQFFRRSLEIAEKIDAESLTTAMALNNTGEVASLRGDRASAEAFFRRALAIHERITPDSLNVAVGLANLGVLALGRGDLDGASALHRRSLALQERLAPDGLAVATNLTALGDIASKQGDPATAAQLHETAFSIRQKLAANSAVEAESLYRLGLLAERSSQRQAADYLRRAIAAVEAQSGRLGGAEEVRSGFTARYADYYRDYIRLLLDLDQAAQAFDTLERSRARSLLAMLAERDLDFASDLPSSLARERTALNADYDRVQATIARLNPGKDPAEIERLLARLRELRDAREAIAQTIRKASPRFASLHYPQPLDLAGVQQSLDAGTVLLAYSVHKNRTFLFVVQPGARPLVPRTPSLSVFTLPIGEITLREKVAAFRRLAQGGQGSNLGAPAALVAMGRELFDTLVKPAQTVIAASERVLISPDGPLHTLPFAALVQPDDGSPRGATRYFIEMKPVHIVVSATVYDELRKTRRSAADARRPTMLAAFGDPSYPSLSREEAENTAHPEVRATVRRGSLFPSLPASRSEVERIARLYGPRAATYLGERATEERAKEIGKGARYLHFATHGLLDERFPLNSALALTIPARPTEGQANGLLQAWEIFEQMRLDADLVTLSACETGLGTEMGGEGLVGLTRAFQYAGARSVLASLWSVADESTAELMTRFYAHLEKGKTKDTALRAAQVESIRARGARSHPFHWAAFQLIGDWK